MPELLARYRNAPPAARRLSMQRWMLVAWAWVRTCREAFLEAAAPGYMTDPEWDVLGEDWLEQAFSYTADPCKGVRGPLTRPRSTRPSSGPEIHSPPVLGRTQGTGWLTISIKSDGVLAADRFRRLASGPQQRNGLILKILVLLVTKLGVVVSTAILPSYTRTPSLAVIPFPQVT